MHPLNHVNNANFRRLNKTKPGRNLISLEDKDLIKYKAKHEVQHILLLRDPFNWMASRITRHFNFPKMDLWVQYAREFCGETNYLADKVCINYNRWFVSESYRREIAQQLNMDYSEETINRIPKFGRSSFDQMEFQHSAGEMAVLNRWQSQSNNHKKTSWEYLGNNLEVFRLSELIFPELPNDQIRAELDAHLSFTRNEI